MSVQMVGGRYRLGRPLGSGGMAQVFDAMDERLERPVAVKLLRAELSGDAGLRRRFEVEARSAARLVHPNVVAVFDTGEAGERPYIVMERLPGDTLADRMHRGPLEEAGTKRLASEVLGALAAAHAAGIVHRDVKPSNILRAADGSAKVGDFGIAKGIEPLLDGQTGDLTATNLVIGTPAYLAPERMEGEVATPRSDLWSLGVVLYEALAGERPFPRRAALARDEPPVEPVPLGVRRPDLDPAFAAAIDRSLAWWPERRFASAADMATAAGVPLAGGSAIAAAAVAGADLATARLENDPQGATAVMGGAPAPTEGQGRTAVLGTGAAGGASAAEAEARRQRTRRLGALAVLAVVLLALAAVGIAALASDNGGSTPPSTTAVPPTTSPPAPTTRPPETTTPTTTATTHPVTTTTHPPTTTTAPPTTTPGPPTSADHSAQDQGPLHKVVPGQQGGGQPGGQGGN